MLDGATPPTLPDRARSSGLLRTGSCPDASGEGSARALWPVALAPWVTQPDCEAPGTALRIQGLDPGAVLRPSPGQSVLRVELSAPGVAGSREPLHWLLNGVHHRRTAAGAPWTLELRHNGRHRITVMDAHGRHHHVDVVVSGLQCATSGCSAAW
jgi:penicillin-binding protein 1C